MRGRPKLSLVRIKVLSDSLKAGNSQRAACADADVSPSTFYDWLAAGKIELDRIEKEGGAVRTERALHVQLVRAVERSLADFEASCVAAVVKQMPKDYRAAEWLLEKRFPGEWGERQRLEITGADGGPIEIMPARSLIAERLAQTNRRILDVVPPELPEALEG